MNRKRTAVVVAVVVIALAVSITLVIVLQQKRGKSDETSDNDGGGNRSGVGGTEQKYYLTALANTSLEFWWAGAEERTELNYKLHLVFILNEYLVSNTDRFTRVQLVEYVNRDKQIYVDNFPAGFFTDMFDTIDTLLSDPSFVKKDGEIDETAFIL